MDKHLNNEELRLQALLEAKNFESLDKNEKAFVLSIISEKEYNLQRKIIIEAQEIYSENNLVAPPLVISNETVQSFWFKKAPIYQTLLAVAATVVIMLLLQTPNDSIVYQKGETAYITQVDTVFETQMIQDTFVEYVDREVVVEKIKYVEVPSKTNVNSDHKVYASVEDPNRKLTPAMQVNLPNLQEPKATSSANSYKNDPTKILINDFVMNN